MKSREYWKERFLQLENSLYSSADETLAVIDEQYREAMKEVEKQISAWYLRVAKNNDIDIQKARKFLDKSELEEFKWDVEKYIKYGRQNAIDEKWIKELENASAKFHISRLEALKIHTRQVCEEMFGKQLEKCDEHFKNTYTESYYHSIYEIQKGFNIGWNIAMIDANKLSKVISKPWTTDGRNFSDRIWSNRASLISELHKQLTQDILLGRAPDSSINAIAKKFNTSKSQAGKLVMTETAYFSSQAQKDCFNELDVEKFEVVETLDTHTCDICGAMDGKVFNMKDFEAGVTAPPYHPWCRGCTVPYFEDNFKGRRVARGEDGETYYVPSDMTYTEWKKNYVDNSAESGIIKEKHRLAANFGSKFDVNNYEIKNAPNEVKLLQEYAQTKVGFNNVDFSNLKNSEVATPFMKQLEKLKNDYGIGFTNISAEFTDKNDIAWVTPDKRLVVNADYFNSKALMNDVIKDYKQKGILPKGADVNYIATHEWGHYISIDDLKDEKSPMHTLFRRTKTKDFVSLNATLNVYEFIADNIAKNICINTCKTSDKVIEYYLKGR